MSMREPGAHAPEPVTVVLSYPPMAFFYGMCHPKVELDGALVGTGWGEHRLPVPDRPARLAVHVPYLGMRAGAAAVLVDGSTPRRLEYRAPAWALMGGDLAVRASTRGVGLVVGVWVSALGAAAAGFWVMSAVVGTLAEAAGGGGPEPVASASDPGPDRDTASVVSASEYVLDPPGAGDAAGIAAVAELVAARVTDAGGVVRVDGDRILVEFDEPPSADVTAGVVVPAVLEWRPVLVQSGPEPFELDAAAAADSAETLSVPEDLVTLFAALDCAASPAPALVPAGSAESAVAVCDARGSKLLLGPVELTSDRVDEVTFSGEVVKVSLDLEGAGLFRAMTEKQLSLPPPMDQFALSADGRILSAPSVNTIIPDGNFEITGGDVESLGAMLAFGRPGHVWSWTSAR